MNILLLYLGRRGGGASYTYEVAKKIAQDKALSLSLCFSRQSDFASDMSMLPCDSLIIDTYTGKWSAILALFRIPFVYFRLCKYIKKRNIDLVLITMSHIWDNILIEAIERSGSKYILVLHDAESHPGDNYMIRNTMLAHEVRNADGVVALTNHVASRAVDLYSYDPERISVVPHGIFKYEPTNSRRVRSELKSILFFGRILPYKGLELLFDAFLRLKEKYPQLSLSIVGPGKIPEKISRNSEIDRLVIDNRWIPEDEIGDIFNRADLVVLPYIEASQSGVASVAFGAGVPVIVTPVGGLGEQIKNHVNGIIADSSDVEAICRAIELLLQDPQLYKQCVEGASRELELTSWDVVSARLVDFMHTVHVG